MNNLKLVSTIISILVVFSSSGTFFAEAANNTEPTEDISISSVNIYSGSCGYNLNCTLDSDGVLTIEGEGTILESNNELREYRKLINEVVFNAPIEEIGAFVFNECSNLRHISLPDSVKKIDYLAFSYSALEDATLGNNVKTIEHAAFYGCENLSRVTIPMSVINIYPDTFKNCTSLSDIYYGADEQSWIKRYYRNYFDAVIHFTDGVSAPDPTPTPRPSSGGGGSSSGGGGGGSSGHDMDYYDSLIPTETDRFSYTLDRNILHISLWGNLDMSYYDHGEYVFNSRTGHFKEIRKPEGRLVSNRDKLLFIAAYDRGCLLSTRVFPIDSVVRGFNFSDFDIELPYEPESLSVKAFLWYDDNSLEPICEPSELTDIPGTAYECYGIVTSIPDGTNGQRWDEVKFDIIHSDYFDDLFGINENDFTLMNYIIKKGNTDIDEHMYEMVHAYVIKDEITDEFTFLSYELMDEAQTVELSSADITDISDVRLAAQGNTYYFNSEPYICVNGVGAGWGTDNSILEKYIKDNPNGSVKLVDRESYADKGDGLYDYIFIEYPVTATVDSIETDDDGIVRITLSNSSNGAEVITWDINDADTNCIIKYRGEMIPYTCLKSGNEIEVTYNILDCGNNTENLEYIYINVLSDDIDIPEPTESVPEEFSLNGVSSSVYVNSYNGEVFLGGSLWIDHTGQGGDMTVSVDLYENDNIAYTKNIALPHGADYLCFSGNAIRDYSGTPDNAIIRVKDSECELYSAQLPLANAQSVFDVNGRIVEIANDGMAYFNIEKADRFEDMLDIDRRSIQYNIKTNIDAQIAEDMFLLYETACIAKNADGYSIISIAPYNCGQVKTFKASQISIDDTVFDYNVLHKIAVKSYDRISYYDMQIWSPARLFVDGVEIGAVDHDTFSDYIVNNPNADVKIIDRTEVASTSTDGKYEYIFVRNPK